MSSFIIQLHNTKQWLKKMEKFTAIPTLNYFSFPPPLFSILLLPIFPFQKKMSLNRAVRLKKKLTRIQETFAFLFILFPFILKFLIKHIFFFFFSVSTIYLDLHLLYTYTTQTIFQIHISTHFLNDKCLRVL